jgi:hypothetical protein
LEFLPPAVEQKRVSGQRVSAASEQQASVR